MSQSTGITYHRDEQSPVSTPQFGRQSERKFCILYYFGVNQSFRPQNLFFGMHRLLLLYNRSLVSMLVNLSCLSTKQFVCMDIYLLQ